MVCPFYKFYKCMVKPVGALNKDLCIIVMFHITGKCLTFITIIKTFKPFFSCLAYLKGNTHATGKFGIYLYVSTRLSGK